MIALVRTLLASRAGRARVFLGASLTLVAVLLFLRLGAPPLADPDEARYARTSVEMLRHGERIVPTYSEQVRLAKPPLLHWMQIMLFRAFGTSAWAARVPSALATLGTMAILAWVARRRFGDEGAAWAVLFFGTQPLVWAVGRLGIVDPLLALHVFAALALDMADPDETGRHKAAAVGALLGLAFLAKGPVGVVLPLLLLLAGRTAAGKHVWPSGRTLWAFLAAWMLVAAPWGLAFVRRVGWATAADTLRREALQRYFTEAVHVEPAWYYAVVLLVGCLPWSALLPLTLARVLLRRRDPATRTALYSGAALLAGLLFFSLGRGKLATYILPLCPCVALLATWELGQQLAARPLRRRGGLLLAGACLLAMLLLGAAASVQSELRLQRAGFVAAAAYGLAGVWGALAVLRDRTREVFAGAVAANVALLLAGALAVHPWMADRRSAAALVRAVPELAGAPTLLLVERDCPSLVFYADRVPERLPLERLAAALDAPGRAWVVLAESDAGRLDPATRLRLLERGRWGRWIALQERENRPAAAGTLPP